jgi:H+/gluconate symporter-like permease
VALGTSTFTMSALPGTPAIQNAIPTAFFGTTPFAAPGLGAIAAVVMFGFGMWWLKLREGRARKAGEGYGASGAHDLQDLSEVDSVAMRELATTAREFDPAEIGRGAPSVGKPSFGVAVLPLITVVAVNLTVSQIILPRIDTDFLALPEWGGSSLSAVGGIWSVAVALLAAIVMVVALNFRRFPALRDSIDAGSTASVLPILSVASLVGFGAVVAAMPAFMLVQDWVLGIEGGLLVSLALATNILAALTGSASGGMTIALQALGPTYLDLASGIGMDPSLLHRVAVIASGTLDSLPHNGAVVTMLAVCGCSHKESYLDIVMVAVVGALLALAVVIGLGTVFGSF